jgi:hypothetical protein
LKLINDLKQVIVNKLAGEEIDELAEMEFLTGKRIGYDQAVKDILATLESNQDIKTIAEGHRANKTQKSQATADALELGYQYAVGLLTSDYGKRPEVI